MKNAIEIRSLKHKYDNGFQLGPLDISIPSGVIVGLIGENGAGKTTLLKSILNLIQGTEGSIQIFGKDLRKEEASIKEEIGVVLDGMFLPEILSVKDIDPIMKGIYKNWDSAYYFDLLKGFGVSSNQQIKKLSCGMRKKLEIATALAHHPKLLILDEATSGLDPVVRNDILDIFQKFIEDEEHTILFSTHITSDLEHIADEILFINQGNIVLEGSRDDILDHYGVLKCDLDSFSEIDKKDMVSYKKNKYDYQILVSNISKVRRKYKNFVLDKVTLEDVMLLMIKGERP